MMQDQIVIKAPRIIQITPKGSPDADSAWEYHHETNGEPWKRSNKRKSRGRR